MKNRASLRWLVYLSGVLSMIIILGSYFISHYYLTFSRHAAYDQVPSDYEMPYQTVDFTSRVDKVNLKGWFIAPPASAATKRNNAATVIVVHGHTSNMGKIGSINLLSHIARPLHMQGFSVFLLDLRNHGQSEDFQPVTLGFWERDDVLGAIDFLEQESSALKIDPKRIGIFGVSMGGATSIYATAADHSSANPHVRALFVESAFARTRDPIELKLGLDGVPSLLQKLLLFWFGTLPERDILQNNPIEHIKSIKSPLYFVHSEKDMEVRPEDSREMHERALKENPSRSASLWISPGTSHASTPGEFPVEFTQRLVSFFENHLAVGNK